MYLLVHLDLIYLDPEKIKTVIETETIVEKIEIPVIETKTVVKEIKITRDCRKGNYKRSRSI